ncbi:MAG: class I SAM-dependent methyltransferase [Burkholderiaceae bacterium]
MINPTIAPGNADSLQAIRAHELEQVLALIPPTSRVLEIGAGAGWQAKTLADHGHAVQAIDVASSSYGDLRIWPVRLYDGFRIPFPDGSFDVVFSSNTLEHISHVERFQEEIRRVLAADGFAIHILPTASWRWWSNIVHYPFVIRMALMTIGVLPRQQAAEIAVASARKKNSLWTLASKILFPPRHGEQGNSLSELWLFSHFRWCPLFARCDWSVDRLVSMRLFCTGYAFLGPQLTVARRVQMSRFMGSSSMAYVVRPKERFNETASRHP